MKNKSIVIKLLVGIIIALTIRFYGIERIPYIVIILLLSFGILYFVWSIFNKKIREVKDKYFLFFALNIIAFSINIIILYTIQVKYSKYLLLVKPIFIPIFIILLISTTISVYLWAFMSKRK